MNQPKSFALFIGVDWASERNDAYVIDCHGNGRHESFDQKVDSIDQWIEEKLRQAEGRPIAIIFENGRNGFVHSMLLRENVVLFPVNPKQFSCYRESHHTATTKSDRDDARLLARMLRERIAILKPLMLDDEKTRKLAYLCQNRRRLVDRRVKLIVGMKSQLKASFPLLLELKISDQALIALVKRWPEPRKLRRANPANLYAVLREAGIRNDKKLDELVKKIRESKLLTPDKALHETMALMFKVDCKAIEQLSMAIEEFEEQIENEMKSHPDANLFTSIPGAGQALAPRLLTAFGSERERFANADEVAARSGIAPVTRQSGKSCQVIRRFACSNYLRQTFHEFAGSAMKWCPWSKAYYRMERSRGMKHNAALRKLAFRWIRILFRVWKNKTPYDPQKYIESMTKKNPKILNFISQEKSKKAA